jgi:hypothetical protein
LPKVLTAARRRYIGAEFVLNDERAESARFGESSAMHMRGDPTEVAIDVMRETGREVAGSDGGKSWVAQVAKSRSLAPLRLCWPSWRRWIVSSQPISTS